MRFSFDLDSSEAATRRILLKRCSYKFRKIHKVSGLTPVFTEQLWWLLLINDLTNSFLMTKICWQHISRFFLSISYTVDTARKLNEYMTFTLKV